MKTKLAGIALFMLTLGTVLYFPQPGAQPAGPKVVRGPLPAGTPKVDVVFVLDTTGSMSGLIQTAKEKIWSIATTMASAQPTPEIRIGLVAYRDRGDEYVTRRVDLSGDLDSVYATLMQFHAGGGGDSPESVNEALFAAVNDMSWSDSPMAYRVVFLVGDAPPHMDYNEMRYPEIVASAAARGIVVNTIQSGDMAATTAEWTAIAALGQGSYFQVEQTGSAVAYASPFDAEIAALSAKLDETRLYYGNAEEKARMEKKMAATELLESSASVEARARRGVFNAAAGGRANLLGENELVDALASGAVELDDIEPAALPAALQSLAPAEQRALVADYAQKREDLTRQIKALSADRDEFIAAKVDEAGGMADSLDQKLYDAVRAQAAEAGLEYADGPAY